MIRSSTVVSVERTARLVEFLSDYRIYLKSYGTKRIGFSIDLEIEPYTAVNRGDALCQLGVMSYVGTLPSWHNQGHRIVIGRYCSFADLSINAPRHPVEAVTTSPFGYSRSKPFIQAALLDFSPDGGLAYADPSKTHVLNAKIGVTIGNDVWFGTGVSLNPGVTVGSGAIVAAHSVVTKDIPPYEIWGGNPARSIRKRFDQEIIDAMLELKWWRYSPGTIARFPLKDPVEFIAKLGSVVSSIEPYEPQKLNIYDALISEGIDLKAEN